MAQLTKAAARSLTQQFIDDPAGKRWSPTNLDILLEGVLDELWGELLDSFAWIRSTEAATLTPVAPGTINLDTALTRFYRLQQVAKDGQAYTLIDPKDVLVVNGVAVAAEHSTYTIMGGLLYLFPLDTVTNSVSVRYNSRPAAFTTLNDTDSVTWPDGYHLAYCYDAAARAMEKGDREESARLGKRAETSLFRLKAFLRKQHIGPVMPYMVDDNLSWGGIA